MTNDAVGATNSTRPGHDLSVVYENRAVPGAEIDLQQWTWANRTTGRIVSYVATGPCPACHGRCEGWGDDASNPIEKKFRGPDTPDPTPSRGRFEVAVTCRCGASHGRDGATGCGRRWTIIGPKSTVA